MTSFFKANFNFQIFKEIIIKTAKYRDENFLTCKLKNKYKTIKTTDISAFLEELDSLNNNGFAKSVFAKSTEGKTGVGNVFSIGIARDFKIGDIDTIIENSWDLFMWLFPSKPIFQRNASLNRSLLKVFRQCEVNSIIGIPIEIRKKKCIGQIEGAHIIPHKNGGSDKLENGLWLCNLHHRLTEGKLEGYRDMENINVKYLNNI